MKCVHSHIVIGLAVLVALYPPDFSSAPTTSLTTLFEVLATVLPGLLGLQAVPAIPSFAGIVAAATPEVAAVGVEILKVGGHRRSIGVKEESPLLYEKREAIAILTFNRPDRLNAVNQAMYLAMDAAFNDLSRDKSVRVVVLTGAGRAFCVGADLKAHGSRQMTEAERRTYVRSGQQACHAIQNCDKPVVAAVNGHAIGAGLEMALSSDLVIVATEAKLRFPEISLGTFVGGGTIYTLVRRVGLTKAKELIMLGEFFTGAEAVTLGLANRAVPAADVLPTALDVAARLAAKAPISMALAKRLLNRAQHLDPETAMDLEAEALMTCMRTSDWKEGIQAFAEKREPHFIGQ